MQKSILSALVAGGVLLAGLPALADPAQDSSTATVAPSQSDNDPDRIVCRAPESVTGTRIPGHRICHTQQQWDELQKQAEQDLMQRQNMGEQSGTPGK